MRRTVRVTTLTLAALVIFGLGFLTGQSNRVASASAPTQTDSASETARFNQLWELLHESYFAQPLDDDALIAGAISGMLETLGDPYTAYMPPTEFASLNDQFVGSYTGIGALVEAVGDELVIVSPFDNSPAKEAGLRPGDVILQVDDTLVSEFEDPLTAVSLVRGPEGEPVSLQINRDGRRFEVTLVRATIPLISALGEMREDGVGYVRISDFGQLTLEQLSATLGELLEQDPTGLVLDLRGNPGGGLGAALEVVSQFVEDGVVMQYQSQERTDEYFAEGTVHREAARLPLVVLVDGGSASASEIVAGAIQDRGRGVLIGEQTFGKGTVQSWTDLGEGNGGVRITIARWLTPNGTWVHEDGIEPDLIVPWNEADRAAERDIQLETAVAYLLGQPLPEPAALPTVAKQWKCLVPHPQ